MHENYKILRLLK